MMIKYNGTKEARCAVEKRDELWWSEPKEQTCIKIEDAPVSTCAFTGHRTVRPEHVELVAKRLSRAVEYVYSRGCRVFYCGGALGFDTLAAREVIRFATLHPDVSLRLVLPCVNQDERWNDRQREAYYYVLRNAECVEYVSEEYTKDCMKRRNMRLAELGDVLVAYLYRDGSGSSQTVRMAKRLGKEVYNLSPELK